MGKWLPLTLLWRVLFSGQSNCQIYRVFGIRKAIREQNKSMRMRNNLHQYISKGFWIHLKTSSYELMQILFCCCHKRSETALCLKAHVLHMQTPVSKNTGRTTFNMNTRWQYIFTVGINIQKLVLSWHIASISCWYAFESPSYSEFSVLLGGMPWPSSLFAPCAKFGIWQVPCQTWDRGGVTYMYPNNFLVVIGDFGKPKGWNCDNVEKKHWSIFETRSGKG